MNELQEEEEKLRKIINIVRPTTLPELTEPRVKETNSKIEITPKVNLTSKSSDQLSIQPIPVEVKKTNEEIKPIVKVKVNKSDNKVEKEVFKESEGILIDKTFLF